MPTTSPDPGRDLDVEGEPSALPGNPRRLITPAILRSYKRAREWLMARWSELEASGWTRRELFRAGDGLRFPYGPWGVAWLPHWSDPRVTPSLEPGGVIVFIIEEPGGRQVRQSVRPGKEAGRGQ